MSIRYYRVVTIITETKRVSPVVGVENGIEHELKLEHDYRERAQGLPVHRIFLILTLDDFSGNYTTRWNCHYLVSLSIFSFSDPS